MEKFDYSALSFKSLKTLKLIYDLGSLTAAAIELGQNQPTISYTLDQMRAALQDPLFVRSGRGVAPTSRCHQIMPEIDKLLRGMSELLQPEEFEPSNANLDVTISCNQYELQIIVPSLVERLNRLAPNIRMAFIQSHVSGHRQLQRGLCDLLLSPVVRDYEALYQRRLFKDRYVCLMSAAHTLAKQPIGLDDYRAAKHVEIHYEGGWKPFYLSAPELQGVNLNVALSLPSVSNLIPTIASTDLLMTLPERLARLIGGSMLIKDPPFISDFELCLYWNKMTHHSKAHQWLREQIIDICSTLDSPRSTT
ncbi:LysR family transcriptional regulator [Amphritea opalescens]|uniref:LysR family transcriptional regulator n=1 Tax=Amphritea opalescens TaxID=2490544 RepID=A0A430KU53_9GAMM|nr:LysR family transcriptional regulator [Amphritea opalescens]RTE67051.1 LysR family transcriptional regulator [Amphritea opalescens]